MNFLKRKSVPNKLRALTVLLATLAFSSLFLSSCKKELFELDKLRDPVWEPSLAVPLINSTLTVPDILERFDNEDVIVVDSDGLLALRYTSELFSVNASQLLQLPDQSTSISINLSPLQIVDIETGSGQASANQNINVTFNTNNGEQLTEITFNSGNLTFDYTNNLPHDASVVVTIPSLTQGGGGFTATHNVPAGTTQSISVPLAGRVLDLTAGGSLVNTFQIQVGITFTRTGAGATPLQSFDAAFGLKSYGFSLIRGDIGQPTISTNLDSVRVRLFENAIDGNVYWEDPKIRAIFTNSYGLGVQVDINTLQSRSNYNPAITLTGSPFGQGNSLNILPATAIGSPAVSSFAMDRNSPGTNIVTVANSSPTKVIYDIRIQGNPGTGPFNNFLADTSKVKLDMEFELPFWGKADNFTKVDSTRFDSLNWEDVEQIQAITFRLAIDNGFPVEAFGQVYFMDSVGTVLDSLLDHPEDAIIAAATVDPGTMRVTQRTKAVTDIILTRQKMDYLISKDFFKNGIMVSKGVAFTTDLGTTLVKVFQDYNMNLRLGVKVDLRQEVKLDSL